MKIASAIITFVLLAGIGFGFFFFLLLALNGFSEREATPSLIFFGVWTFVFAVGLAVGGFFLTKLLIAKSFNAILALILSIIAAVAFGFVADFGGLIISTIIASEVRESYRK